jgi:hypothetical protein
MPGAGNRSNMKHAWLRANGDTAAYRELPPNATDAQRIRVLGEDILGHFKRANDLLAKGQFQPARVEVRDAAPVMTMLRELYGSDPAMTALQRSFAMSVQTAMTTCRQAIADSAARVPANFRCEGLFPGFGRGNGRGRAPGQLPGRP